MIGVKDGVKEGVKPPVFKPLSKYPSCYKDVSFYLPAEMKSWRERKDLSIEDDFSYNDMCEIIRNESGDLVEEIELIDEFFNKKTNKTSLCYRIHYRSHERNLLNTEIDAIQLRIRDQFTKQLQVQLR